MAPFVEHHYDKRFNAMPRGTKSTQVAGEAEECIKYITFPGLFPPDRVWKERNNGLALGGD